MEFNIERPKTLTVDYSTHEAINELKRNHGFPSVDAALRALMDDSIKYNRECPKCKTKNFALKPSDYICRKCGGRLL